jgi:hypothetical protein
MALQCSGRQQLLGNLHRPQLLVHTHSKHAASSHAQGSSSATLACTPVSVSDRHVPNSRFPRQVATAALPGVVAQIASSPYRDGICMGLAAVGNIIWVKLFNLLATNGVLEQVRSRWLETGRFCVGTGIYRCPDVNHIIHKCSPMQKLSRKLVHISAGPLFVCTWPLFR